MKYYIAVEIDPIGPIADLTTSLRRAYAAGVKGDFHVLVTHAPTYLVVFMRSVQDDARKVSDLAQCPYSSIELAAMHLLADDLANSNPGPVVQPIINVLREGDAQCFDYGIGAFEAIAEYEPESEPQQESGLSISEQSLSREAVISLLAQHDESGYPGNISYYADIAALAETTRGSKNWSSGQIFVYATSAHHFIVMKQIAPASCEMLTISHKGFHDVLTAYRFEQQGLVDTLEGYLAT
ncbi:hypothetical protein MCEMSEM18_03512 [Comamonadaceae bacterium]